MKNRTDKRDYSRWVDAFCSHLNPAYPILDVGCGVGQHMKAFAGLGYQVLGIEPSPRMRQLAAQQGLAVMDGSFEALDELDLPPLSGIWCAASLLHVPREHLPEVAQSLARRLSEGQPLFVTVRVGEGAKWDRYDDLAGAEERFIQLFPADYMAPTLAAAGLEIRLQEVEDSYWGRPSKWLSLIALKV